MTTTDDQDLYDADGRPLRPITPLRLVRPASVTLERGRLRISPGKGTGHRSPSDLLQRFLACDTTDDGLIARFVREHEPLSLCEHELPVSHRAHGFPKPKDAQTIYVCRPTDDEPVERYRAFARQMRGIIRAAQDLRLGDPPDGADWNNATAGPVPVELGPLPPAAPQRIAEQRRQIAQLVRAYIACADLRPGLVWEDEPYVEYRGGLFAALAAQLMEAVISGGGLLHCKECGRDYRAKRAPRPGERNVCPTCRERGVDRARNVRETRRRRRAVELARMGRSLEQIGDALGVDTDAARRYIERGRELEQRAARRAGARQRRTKR